jgi:hypothetical protein
VPADRSHDARTRDTASRSASTYTPHGFRR